MDNKGSSTNLAFWLPGSAVILSLVVSMFALNREPFLEPRPIGAQFQAQLPIEARLWQDPFDLLAAGHGIVWWRIEGPQNDHDARLASVRGVPITLYMVAAGCAFIATRFWHSEFLWFTFVLILLGIVSSNLTRRSARQLAMAQDLTGSTSPGLYDSRAWYIVVPLVMFILALMWRTRCAAH